MRIFFRFAAGLALSALLALLLLLAVLLVSPQAAPSWSCGIPLGGEVAALAVSLVLLFLVVFFSPSLSGSDSSARKKKKGLAQERQQANKEDCAQKRASAAAPSPSGAPRAAAAISADFVARAVSRAAEQAVVSLVPELAKSASAAAELSGCYVSPLPGGFEGVVPKESRAAAAQAPNPITSRDGIFVIDADAASSMDEGAEIDRDFKSLVDSVLA